MPACYAAITPDDERAANLVRVAELLDSPSAVPLIDHYLDRLLAAGRDD